MHTSSSLLPLLLPLLPLASAHFNLVYPVVRGFNEDTSSNFPCGGQNTPSPNRTLWPLSGAPIQLYMGHTASKVQVLLALGNNPGDNFNFTLVPTLQEQGPQNFCLGNIDVSAVLARSGVNVTALQGANATLQVVSNGDPSGGLYNCADITFTSTPLTATEMKANCQNSTGVMTMPIAGAAVNANSSSGASSSSGMASGTASGTAASATASKTGNAAAAVTAMGWAVALGVLGVAGAVGL
ncbi:hypothetical protein LTR28_012793 [Elasticomyces elasticus]|nr:hypothetical protein LTR28_012793 [Elasticomyces elasticus]